MGTERNIRHHSLAIRCNVRERQCWHLPIGKTVDMRRLRHIAAWVRRETGQDLIEYGLLAVLIAVVVAVALPTLGGVVRDYYETIWTAVRDAGM